MKFNILDICHETISDESDVSVVLSIKMTSELEGETRININYNDSLVEFCASEMNENKQVKDFFLKVTDLYFLQNL
tara:strand:+ start:1966 stop:2193 length:228 start_codon:yes stop_codon:yes gene_type:complete